MNDIDPKLDRINENLGRIATCLEAFLAVHEESKNQDMTVVMKDAMAAFRAANPILDEAMKAMDLQLSKGNSSALTSSRNS